MRSPRRAYQNSEAQLDCFKVRRFRNLENLALAS